MDSRVPHKTNNDVLMFKKKKKLQFSYLFMLPTEPIKIMEVI